MEKINDLKGQVSLHLYKEALQKWHSMHSRLKRKGYANTTICAEWYTFSNYYYWYLENSIRGWDVDKDMLGANHYSPSTCMFVPHEVNQLFRGGYGKYKKGVQKVYNSWVAKSTYNGVQEYYGTFATEDEAHQVYLQHRQVRIQNLATKYSNYPVLSTVLLNSK
ncbi:TPA: hypothetical protein ACF3IV_000663 [Enterobacter hormaechei]